MGGLRRAVFDGDIENGSVMMGQVAGLIEKRATIAEIFETIIQEAKEEKEKLTEKIDLL